MINDGPHSFGLSPDAEAIEQWLLVRLSEQLGISPEEIDPEESLTSYGVASAEAVSLSGELEEWLGRKVPATVAYDHPTIRGLARYLAKDSEQQPSDKRALTEASTESEGIAIIGVGCRFPGAQDADAFWNLLRDGKHAVSEVPQDRWDLDEFYDSDPAKPGRMNTRWGGFLDRVDEFDCSFFGISRREASRMDPQQRLLLEVAWEALENASLAADRLAGTRTGVFVGISSNDYGQLQFNDRNLTDAYAGTGNALSIAASRISYVLNLHGPSVAVDTACSSSLVATHLACQSLRTGECEMALVGGVNIILSPMLTVNFTKAGFMASDGRCKAFDARANGYVRGEGAGIVVLKPLNSALRDRDPIYAVIRGSAVNHDGRTNGITAPNGPAQERVLREAYRMAGINPGTVQYVEAHGTGTSLGDPIEAKALGKVLNEGRVEGSCAIGSVKTNIGHLEAAAGIAGLIKVALSFRNGMIPPSLNFEEPNPHIPFEHLSLHVQTRLTSWPHMAQPATAGVSSFGFGGTNAHVVLTAPPPIPSRGPKAERPVHILSLSAKTESALLELTRHYGQFLEQHPSIRAGDLCFTASAGRPHFDHRQAVVGSSSAELGKQLELMAAGKRAPGAYQGHVLKSKTKPPIAFLFTGQGSQYVGMGTDLYRSAPVFREALERCATILRSCDVPLIDLLYSPPDAQSRTPSFSLNNTRYAQPALFSLEYALAELWKSWGIEPSVVFGHSVGEYVAACVADVMDLEDSLKLIAHRGRLMQELSGTGAMAVVFAPQDIVEEALAEYADQASVAAINGPENLVIAGMPEAIASILQALTFRGIESRKLNASRAFHSPMMDPVLEEFEGVAREISFREPSLMLVSNVTGRVIDRINATYWRKQVRSPVRFRTAMETLRDKGCELFVELGPDATLSGMGRRCVEGGRWLSSLRKRRADWQQMLETLAQLYVRGVDADWEAYDRPYDDRKIALPTYPFQRQRCWFDLPRATPRVMKQDGGSSSVVELLDRGDAQQLARYLESSGQLVPDQKEQIRPLLEILVRAHQSDRGSTGKVVEDYYDALAREGRSREDDTPVLTFGLFPDIVPGFSWVRSFTDASETEFRDLAVKAQRELRRLLFEEVNFARCRKVLDVGCGYASDLIDLAQKNGHLQLTGYTLSSEQARIGHKKVRRLELEDRVKILNRDSAHDAFPDAYDLIFSFEVAHHIKDKNALFANIGDHLKAGGLLVLGDFISNFDLPIDHEVTSSYIITKEQWIEQLSSHHLRIMEAIDVSHEVGNFLYDPTFDQTLTWLSERNADESIRNAFKSYDQLGRLLRTGKATYVLLQAEKRPESSETAIRDFNRERLSQLDCYAHKVVDQWFYELNWKAQTPPIPAAQLDRPGTPATWLLLLDAAGVGASLIRRLEERGHHCVVVSPGSRGRIDPDHYEIEPTQTEGFERLLRERFSDPVHLAGVLHLWSLTPTSFEITSANSLRRSLELSCGSALGLLQALAAQHLTATVPLWLVTHGTQSVNSSPVPHPEHASLWGLGRVIGIEHPELDCRMVDLDPAAAPFESAESLWTELPLDDVEKQVAYRRDTRHVVRLERWRPDNTTENGTRITSDATYLVTGGLGALGREIAQWLVRRGARYLVLAGRSEPSPQAQAVINRLRQTGVEILVSQTDVSREDEIAGLLRHTRKTFPPLRGIVHAAATVDEGPLTEQNWERFSGAMVAKVLGAWHLHRLAQPEELDFFICFSSIAAILTSPHLSPHLASYAAANTFLDALMQHRHQLGMAAMSINWGPWAEAGLAVRSGTLARLRQQGIGGISTERGLKALEKLLLTSKPQLMVAPVAWKTFAPLSRSIHGESVLETLEPRNLGPAETVTPEISRLTDLLANLRQAPSAAQRKDLVQTSLREQIGRVLHMTSDELDPEEDLSAYGLDSIIAMEVASEWRRQLRINVSPTEIFKTTRLSDLADYITRELTASRRDMHQQIAGSSEFEESKELKEVRSPSAHTDPPTGEARPLSFGQEGLWFFDQFVPRNPVYNEARAIRISGKLDIPALAATMNEVVRRHEILRTTFPAVDGRPLQQLHALSAAPLPLVNLEDLQPPKREEEARRLLQVFAESPFRLDAYALFRTLLIQHGETESIFAVSAHHIVCDGSSMNVFAREVSALYDAFHQRKPSPLPPLPIQYSDFVQMQRRAASEQYRSQVEYWRTQLSDVSLDLHLPLDRPRPAVQTFRGEKLAAHLPRILSDEIRTLSEASGVTLFMTLLASFKLLLFAYTGTSDIVVGIPIANRSKREVRDLIGFFVNTLVLRTNLSGDPSFLQLLERVRDVTRGAYMHSEVPSEQLLEELRPKRNVEQITLVQAGFGLVTQPPRPFELMGLETASLEIPMATAKTDLSLFVYDAPDTLSAVFEYSTDIFSEKTIKCMADNFQQLLERMVADPSQPISRVCPMIKSVEPHIERLEDLRQSSNLTRNQLLIWLSQKLLPELPVFNVATALTLHGPVDETSFRKAFQWLVDCTDTFRTVIHEVDGLPQQRVVDALSYELTHLDFSTMADPESSARAWINERARTPLQLEERAFDSVLLKLSEHKHIWYLNQHHTLTDGWSLWLIYHRMTDLYARIREGESAADVHAPAFQEYVEFEKRFRDSPDYRAAELYWAKTMSDLPEPLEFYGKTPRGYAAPVRRLSCPLGAERSRQLRQSGTPGSNLRPPELLFAAFCAYLYLTSGNHRLMVGHMYHNRPEAFAETPGLFMQILPVRLDIEPAETFSSLAAKVKQSMDEGIRHGRYAVSNPVQERAYDAVVNHFATPTYSEHGFDDAPVNFDFIHSGSMLESLCMRIIQLGTSGSLAADFDFRCDVFEEEDAQRATQHFLRTLDAFLSKPGQRLDAVDLLTTEERTQLVTEFNDTQTPLPGDETFMGGFEAVAQNRPDRVAVRCDDSVLTYGALRSRAIEVGSYLRHLGIGPECMVGVYLDRSIEMLVAILGIWEAGAAYVPLDPRYPSERIQFMLADSRARILLTRKDFRNGDAFSTMVPESCQVLSIDADWEEIAGNPAFLPSETDPENLAYSIYTSGSTGKPKGAMVHHHGMFNHLFAKVRELALSETDSVAQTASPCFDISIWQFMAALLTGGNVQIYPDEVALDPITLARKLEQDRVSILEVVPSVLGTMLRDAPQRGQLSGLRWLLVTGEALSPEFARLALMRYPNVPLVNAYGPTECSDDVTHFVMKTPPGETVTNVPIGHALGNTQLFILHRSGNLAPRGASGELYVGGLGVGRGYAKDPARTAAAFLPNCFVSDPGQRVYRTGDRAQYLDNGDILFLGRLDHQVKIRGFRIEPGEIEAILATYPGIREAVVTLHGDEHGQDRLVAYLVPKLHDLDSEGHVLNWQTEHASQWQTLWEDTYSAKTELNDPTFNTIGWNSSYSNLPFPEEQMKEWVTHTVNRVLREKPKHILEIGCGTGLLLFRLARHCTDYWGTDFSEGALDYTRTQLDLVSGGFGNVRLLHREANDFQDIPEKFFDAIVLNSVAQYFPSIEYLMQVLAKAVDRLVPGGFVYLGDLRSLTLLETFHASVQVHQAQPSLRREELRQRIERELRRDEELVIDPEFFYALKAHMTRIDVVQVQLKRGICHNELTKFRYDVMLHVERDPAPLHRLQWQSWGDGLSTLEGLRVSLERTRPKLLGVSNISNARLTADNRAVEWLASDSFDTVGEWRNNIDGLGDNAVDPEELWSLAEMAGYDVSMTWSVNNRAGAYDAIFKRLEDDRKERANSELPPLVIPRTSTARDRRWSDYANNPLQAKFNLGIVPRLREFLQKKLPDYMIPSVFLMLEALPRTPNGKVDLKALPQPEINRNDHGRSFVPPRTSVEETVARIWQEVLGMERVSVHDDFFELGGHSLLAVQVISRVRHEFEIEIPVRHLFEATTVAGLAELIERIQWASQDDEPANGEEVEEGEV